MAKSDSAPTPISEARTNELLGDMNEIIGIDSNYRFWKWMQYLS